MSDKASMRRRWVLAKRAPGMMRYYGVGLGIRWFWDRVVLGNPLSAEK